MNNVIEFPPVSQVPDNLPGLHSPDLAPVVSLPPFEGPTSSVEADQPEQMHLDPVLIKMFLAAETPEARDILSRVMVGKAVVDYLVDNSAYFAQAALTEELLRSEDELDTKRKKRSSTTPIKPWYARAA